MVRFFFSGRYTRGGRFTVQNPACYTTTLSLTHSPYIYHSSSSSPLIADAQNMVKQYAFYMKRALVSSLSFFFSLFFSPVSRRCSPSHYYSIDG